MDNASIIRSNSIENVHFQLTDAGGRWMTTRVLGSSLKADQV